MGLASCLSLVIIVQFVAADECDECEIINCGEICPYISSYRSIVHCIFISSNVFQALFWSLVKNTAASSGIICP